MNLKVEKIKTSWLYHFQSKAFKLFFYIGIFALIAILLSFPVFFNHIEKRQGVILDEIILKILPSLNLSYYIFAIIWGTSLILIIESIKNPKIFIGFLWSFIFLSLSRMLTITLVPLEAPKNLIPLIDPISNTFYGGKFLTKDLFYSGHTATQLLIYIHLQKKWQKNCTLLASILIGIMVLIQHVHYSIDVIFAFVFTPIIAYFTKKVVLSKIK